MTYFLNDFCFKMFLENCSWKCFCFRKIVWKNVFEKKYFWKIVLENNLKNNIWGSDMFNISVDMRTKTALVVTTVANCVTFQRATGSSHSRLFPFQCLSPSPHYLGPSPRVSHDIMASKNLFSSAWCYIRDISVSNPTISINK